MSETHMKRSNAVKIGHKSQEEIFVSTAKIQKERKLMSIVSIQKAKEFKGNSPKIEHTPKEKKSCS